MVAHAQALCDLCGDADAVELIRERSSLALASSSFSARSLGVLDTTRAIADTIRKLSKEGIEALGGVEAVKQTVGELFDTYVAPIDLPYVPNIAETMVVDPWLRKMLLRIVDEVAA